MELRRLSPVSVLSGTLLCLATAAPAAIITGVTVTDASTAYSAAFSSDKAVDGETSDYASLGAGSDTFIKFAFPAAQPVNRVVVMNRDSPAQADWIMNFTLTFDGGASVSITRTASRGVSAIIPLGATFTTSTVLLEVDSTGSVSPGGNTGVQEVIFLSPMTGRTAVSGVTVAGSATAFNAEYAATNSVDGIIGRANAAGQKPEYASASLGTAAYVDFDLGAILPVSGFDFFDRPAAADRVTAFDMIFSVNSTFGDADDVVRSFTNSKMAMSAEFADTTARYVRYDVTATSGSATANTGLSEIVFYSTVPEPAASLSALAALTGLSLRRRRRHL